MTLLKKTILSLSLVMFIGESLVSQITTHGVTLPAKLGREDVTLNLNGGGVRNKYFMNVYVAGLYVKSKSSNAKDIINANEPMAVRLQIISNLVTKDRMAESIEEGFEKSTNGNTKSIEKEMTLILKVFNSEPIKVGDYFDIWYFPGKGVMAWKNGKKYDFTISGMTFKKALFGIWLGEDPVDDPLKDKMLDIKY